ncbi:UNVERIFIED_CONTAM: dockerin type I repeat protein [Acetivibrio alkalicellulosi]
MNGKFYYNMDLPLFKYENEFMLTLRTCGSLINGSVEYDVALREVIFAAENRVLKIEVDSKNLFLNGEEISFPVTPITHNGRFCIPLNLLAQAFNYNVAVDYESEIIYWGFLYGDANYDGVIDSSDYVLLKRHILELSNMSNKIICDLNYDGLINSTDLAILKRLILNIKTQ